MKSVKDVFSYDNESGLLTRISTGKRIAGCNNGRGYLQVRFNGKLHYYHRLVWSYFNGNSEYEIDHINGVRTDNRIENLRPASHRQNMQNLKRARSDNLSSKLLGVTLCGGKWRAKIKKDGHCFHVGYFKSKDDAHNAYLKAKRQIHEFCEI